MCSMAGLLAKFRIDYSDLKVIPDINKKPQESTSTFFDKLITDFQQGKPDDGDSEDAEGISFLPHSHILWNFYEVFFLGL